MNTYQLPTITELADLIKVLKTYITEDCRPEDGGPPMMDLTVGWSKETGQWNYQTGDNSYTGGAYSYPDWAVVTLTRRSNSRELAKEIREQLAELACQ